MEGCRWLVSIQCVSVEDPFPVFVEEPERRMEPEQA